MKVQVTLSVGARCRCPCQQCEVVVAQTVQHEVRLLPTSSAPDKRPRWSYLLRVPVGMDAVRLQRVPQARRVRLSARPVVLLGVGLLVAAALGLVKFPSAQDAIAELSVVRWCSAIPPHPEVGRRAHLWYVLCAEATAFRRTRDTAAVG